MDKLEITYQTCKKVYEKKLSKKEGVLELVGQIKTNPGYAQIQIDVFLELMMEKTSKRTLSNSLFKYFLEKILQDYGLEQLRKVIDALNSHIEYFESASKKKIELKSIINKYVDILKNESFDDEVEQNEIITYLKKSKSRQEIINDLKNLSVKEPEIITVNNKSYKRDNNTIAQIKIIRDFKCQICETYILKKDGSRYVEAAHITPKHKQGQETPENIILLCPNHHKEFDFGHLEIIEPRTKSFVEFTLNTKFYKISLEIE
jgi:predicted restriction endonuclease